MRLLISSWPPALLRAFGVYTIIRSTVEPETTVIEAGLEALDCRLAPESVAVIDRVPAARSVVSSIAWPLVTGTVPRIRFLSLKVTCPSERGARTLEVETVAAKVTGRPLIAHSSDSLSFTEAFAGATAIGIGP